MFALWRLSGSNHIWSVSSFFKIRCKEHTTSNIKHWWSNRTNISCCNLWWRYNGISTTSSSL